MLFKDRGPFSWIRSKSVGYVKSNPTWKTFIMNVLIVSEVEVQEGGFHHIETSVSYKEVIFTYKVSWSRRESQGGS